MRRREDPLFAWIGSQPDAAEGVVSFLEKRAPAWKLTSGSARELLESK